MSTRSSVRNTQRASDKLIESINELTPSNFVLKFFAEGVLQKAGADLELLTGETMHIDVHYASDLIRDHANTYESCFRLIEESSAPDYQKSEMKWSPTKKRQEMLLPDMRYLIVSRPRAKPETDATADAVDASTHDTVGFVSFMFTYEDGHEVLYIYEIHLMPGYRSQGIGKLLLRCVENAGQTAGVEKCMLTVFHTNGSAVKWYDRQGYRLDDFSPPPRVLRNGRLKAPTYMILSKAFEKQAVEQ